MKQPTEAEVAVSAFFEAKRHHWAERSFASHRDWIFAAMPHIGPELRADAINSYLEEKQRQGRKPQTLTLYRRALAGLCQWAEEHGYSKQGEAAKINTYSKSSPMKRDYITHKEYERIIKVTEEEYPQVADPFRIAYWTGLRCYDVYRLAKEHIDQAESAIIMVPHKTTRYDRRIFIPIDWSTELGETLLRNMDLAPDDTTPFFEPWYAPRSKPGANLQGILPTIQQKAGVRKFTFHTFRRTFLTNLMNSGAPPQVATAVTGIAKPEILMRYVVPQADGIRKIMNDARKYTVERKTHGTN